MTIKTSDTWERIQALTNPHFLKTFGIANGDDVGGIRSVRPDQLLSPLRFDIFAKHIYATFWNQRLNSDWGRDIYVQHLKAFNNFDEGDGSGKSSLDVFLNTFHEILESVQKDGFMESQSLVPVSRSGVVIDGSHRVAAAVFHNRNVSVAELNTSGFVFDYHFFQSRGMPPQYMDAVGLEFCRINRNAYVALLFPTAAGHHDRVVEILNTHGQIFYEKESIARLPGQVCEQNTTSQRNSW